MVRDGQMSPVSPRPRDVLYPPQVSQLDLSSEQNITAQILKMWSFHQGEVGRPPGRGGAGWSLAWRSQGVSLRRHLLGHVAQQVMTL